MNNNPSQKALAIIIALALVTGVSPLSAFAMVGPSPICIENPADPSCLPPIPPVPPIPSGPSCDGECSTTLTVIKELIKDNGSTDDVSSFDYYIDESKVTSGVANSVSEGSHQVSENDPAVGEGKPARYTTTFSGACDADGNVSLESGDAKNCVITNDDISPKLNIIANVINNSGGAAVPSAFTIFLSRTNGTTSFPGIATPGYPASLNAGAYSVFTPGIPGYTVSLGTDCSGSIDLGETKTCTVTFDDLVHAVTEGGGESLGGSGGNFGQQACSGTACGGGTPAPTPAPQPPVIAPQGQVLGETIDKPAPLPVAPVVTEPAACTPYLNSYIKYGRKNDPEDVRKLQKFLQQYMGADLEVTGIYDLKTFNAVKAFQVKEDMEILMPWTNVGIKISHKGTGYVYKTTKRRINNIMCESLNLPMPALR